MFRLPLLSGLCVRSSWQVKFNASLAALAVAACAPESFAPTPRHPEASVKIQGRAVGGAAGGVAGPLKPEFRSACTGLTQGKVRGCCFAREGP